MKIHLIQQLILKVDPSLLHCIITFVINLLFAYVEF